MKYRKHLKVMHFMEEIENDENYLDDSKEKKEVFYEDEGYFNEDEIDNDEEDVEIIRTIDTEEITENVETAGCNKPESEYWIHEKVARDVLDTMEECHIHSYNNEYICRRYNLNRMQKKDRNQLLEENVLDVTRNFNRRVQSFRSNLLMAPQSPLKIQFFQDRTEMQSRGFGHIHGCAWSDFGEL